MNSTQETQSVLPSDPLSRSAWRRFGCALLIAFAGTVLLLAAWNLRRSGAYRELDRPGLEMARERWRENGVPDYDIEIRVTGRQPATYRVEVRNGEPVLATRNGQPLTQKRTWTTWTVPGMFGTVESDLEQLERARRGEPGIPGLSVLVEFDPRFGYPKRYLRVESMRQGANPEVTWEVTKFLVHK